MKHFKGLRWALALTLALAPVAEVSARGFGGGGGGFRGGGGGGFRGGGFSGGGFSGGGYRGGGFSGGGFSGGGYRSGGFSGGNFSGGNAFRGGSEFNRTPSFSSSGNFQPHYQNFNSGNRANFGNTANFNGGNRSFNQANVNRAGNVNNFNGGNRSFNQTNINRSGNVNNFNGGNRSFNQTNINNFNRAGNYGWHGNAYSGYHSGWVNGYWPGHYNNWGGGWGRYGYGYGGFGWGLGTGLALGSLATWAYGPMLYNWGYSSYSNPYYYSPPAVVVAGQPAIYDYSSPINTQAAPPADDAKDQALQTFDSARTAFKSGDYAGALLQTDQALQTIPGDPAMHQFRALCLFALGRYDEQASTLYAVLAAGPGWDWTTLIGLYPDVDTYTTQLRALEAFITANKTSAPARFDLAYQYMTEGHADAAVRQLKVVTSLQPGDKVSAQLIQQLTPPPAGTTDAANANPNAEQVPPNPTPDNNPPQGTPGDLNGTWTANPADKVAIELTIKKDGPFTWKVTQAGKSHEFGGDSTLGDNLLTLAPKDGGTPMVGKIFWQDPNHFKFQVAGGGGPNDPGLAFSR